MGFRVAPGMRASGSRRPSCFSHFSPKDGVRQRECQGGDRCVRWDDRTARLRPSHPPASRRRRSLRLQASPAPPPCGDRRLAFCQFATLPLLKYVRSQATVPSLGEWGTTPHRSKERQKPERLAKLTSRRGATPCKRFSCKEWIGGHPGRHPASRHAPYEAHPNRISGSGAARLGEDCGGDYRRDCEGSRCLRRCPIHELPVRLQHDDLTSHHHRPQKRFHRLPRNAKCRRKPLPRHPRHAGPGDEEG